MALSFAVVGAGAIGAYVGAALARADHPVTLIARGEHLRAMRDAGVHVRSPRGDFEAHPKATDRIEDVGAVDVVLLSVKAHQIEPLLPTLPTLFHEHTVVVSMQNGLPWWYFQRHGGPYDGWRLETLDPAGRIAATIAPERVIGSTIYIATELEAPGVIHHVEGTRLSLGEPDRSLSARLEALAGALVAGGLKAPVEREIRAEIWLKLLGNASFNPISALTHATLRAMTDDALVEPLVREMMEESLAIADRLGVRPTITIERRIEGARQVGAHKTSMLQDLEAGKALEIEALVGAVVELGGRLEIPTPATRHVYALVKLLERTNVARHASYPSRAGRAPEES